MLKDNLGELVRSAAKTAYEKGEFPSSKFPEVEIEEPKVVANGDFSTNISMKMASVQKMPPRKIAETLLPYFNDPDQVIQKIEIAGPGFINFFMKPSFWHEVIKSVHQAGSRYGASDIGNGKRIQIEFVSSNPTGPLHVGHGRGAAVGDSLANILSFCGYDVEKEYYINDSGRQIYNLGRSVFLRLKELSGEIVQFPEECYQGDYIRDLAKSLKNRLVADAGDDKEDAHESSSDAPLEKMSDEADAISRCARFAAEKILDGMREDLESFGVTFDNWFSEQSLYDSGKVDDVIRRFLKMDVIYEKDGALWFKTKQFGDEKDRVVVKKDGQKTYFASDIAYHQDKFERGFEKLIDVWGADHHGYIQRLAASIEASGFDKQRFGVILVQLVNLLRGGAPVAMSTRAGEFVTLRDVINEVGRDAARFIFLTRHYDSPLEFDLEIAKKKTNENPVYYVQYVHARISSIVRKARERGVNQIACDKNRLAGLNAGEEIELMKMLARYPEAVKASAEFMEPHRLTFYLMNLASNFHAYYNKHRVLTDDPELTYGRLCLVVAVQNVIRDGLSLLGVSAPHEM